MEGSITGVRNQYSEPYTGPVIRLDVPHPTADKPQSKIWYRGNIPWAILQSSEGPTVWERLEGGWYEHTEIGKELKGLPGRVDVYSTGSRVLAAGVDNTRIGVFELELNDQMEESDWLVKTFPDIIPPEKGSFETATIVLDHEKELWVASTSSEKVWVWTYQSDFKIWSDPIQLAEGIDSDDICTLTKIQGGIGVIWSDQESDGVYMRIHKDGTPYNEWRAKEIIDQGGNTADDHINSYMSADNFLWVATKNSVDTPGKAQFVLRVRTFKGSWINKPYCILENTMKRPSRPIVSGTVDGSMIFTAYGDNDRSVPYPYNATIVVSAIDRKTYQVGEPKVVIYPDPSYNSFIQNVTGPKEGYPIGAPWIILASDGEGKVYEADLKTLLK